jgi:Ca2+-binding RTX toxin-like protein
VLRVTIAAVDAARSFARRVDFYPPLEEGPVMYRTNWIQTSLSPRRRARKAAAFHRAVDNTLEPLESRRLYAVTASAAGGVLTVLGDNNPNAITVSRNAAGNLLVNNGAVPIAGSPATVATIQVIHVSGFDGNDNLLLDETNGALPAASLSGGSGNDTLTGGAGADTLRGDDGNDVLFGKGGDDTLFGGNGNDSLTGGVGTDQAFGEAGDDRMIWNPGEGSDLNEGGDGNDTVEVIGGNVDEVFTATANGTRVRFDRTSPGPFFIDIGTSENLVLNAAGGNDRFTAGNGLAPLIKISVDGGTGNDTLTGGDGADTLIGGDGNDSVNGGRGNDVALLGAGDDVFVWNPGEGSDTVEGQGGADLMLFNGSDDNENVDLSADHGRLRFFRDRGNVTMDVNGVETVEFNALGGADNIVVHDLRHTDVTQVDLNLLSSTGGRDGATDNVLVEGSRHRDFITVSGSGGSVSVNGLAAAVNIRGAEPTDTLTVNSLAGNDLVNASGLDANAILFTADGGKGNDLLIGGAGDDTLLGGDGNDILFGGAGNDQLDGGDGHNLVIQ